MFTNDVKPTDLALSLATLVQVKRDYRLSHPVDLCQFFRARIQVLNLKGKVSVPYKTKIIQPFSLLRGVSYITENKYMNIGYINRYYM